jgi:hypothetical protein
MPAVGIITVEVLSYYTKLFTAQTERKTLLVAYRSVIYTTNSAMGLTGF